MEPKCEEIPGTDNLDSRLTRAQFQDIAFDLAVVGLYLRTMALFGYSRQPFDTHEATDPCLDTDSGVLGTLAAVKNGICWTSSENTPRTVIACLGTDHRVSEALSTRTYVF